MLGLWVGFAGIMMASADSVVDVDEIRLPPKVSERYGSLLEPTSLFHTWTDRVLFLETALSEFGQRALRLKGYQLYTGPELGLLVSAAIRRVFPPYSVQAPARSSSFVATQQITSTQTVQPDEFFEFKGVDFALDEATSTELNLDLNFSLGYNVTAFQSADQWLNKWGINVLPSKIDAERDETERISFKLPFAVSSAAGGFQLGPVLASELLMAVRTKTTFHRQGPTLGMYTEVTLRADIDVDEQTTYQAMTQFNFLAHQDTGSDPLVLSGPIRGRFCLKEGALQLPSNAINLVYGAWLQKAVSNLPDIQAGLTNIKTIFSQNPISLDMFFPLAERAANEQLARASGMSIMLDDELSTVPIQYRCDLHVELRVTEAHGDLQLAKHQYYQHQVEQGFASRVMEDEAGLWSSIGDVAAEKKKRVEDRLDQAALSSGQVLRNPSRTTLQYLREKNITIFGNRE